MTFIIGDGDGRKRHTLGTYGQTEPSVQAEVQSIPEAVAERDLGWEPPVPPAPLTARWLVFRVASQLGNNSSAINELRVRNQGTLLPVTVSVTGAYDQTESGLPNYWNSGSWSRSNLTDGQTTYSSGNTALFLHAVTEPHDDLAWFAVDLGADLEFDQIELWGGQTDGGSSRKPSQVTVYTSPTDPAALIAGGGFDNAWPLIAVFDWREDTPTYQSQIPQLGGVPSPNIRQQLSLNDFTAASNAGHTVAPSSTGTIFSVTHAWRAFDGVKTYFDTDYRAAGWSTTSGGLIYTFPSAVTVTEIWLWNNNNSSSHVDSFTVEGSNDGTNWTSVRASGTASGDATAVQYSAQNPAAYSMYRLTFVNDTPADNSVNVIINEIELWGFA